MKRLKKSAPLSLGAILLVGQLYAQPVTSQPASPTAKQQQQVQLSVAEMEKEAQALRDRVRADIQRVQHLRAKARKAQDIIQLTCVNDKFVKLKASANLFDEAHRELLADSTTNRNETFVRVQTTASEVRKVREEADVCIGNQELARESANDWLGPEIIDDPTLGLPFDIEIEPPSYASPYT